MLDCQTVFGEYCNIVMFEYVPPSKGRGTYCVWCGSRRCQNLARGFHVCKISHEIVGGLEPNLHGYCNGAL